MLRSTKIYILKAVKIDFDSVEKSELNELSTFVGYFTNLKELYNKFDSDTIQSYSTVSAHIKKKGVYVIKDPKFSYREEFERFNEISITKVLANNIYSRRDYISLSDLLIKEASRINRDGLTIYS